VLSGVSVAVGVVVGSSTVGVGVEVGGSVLSAVGVEVSVGVGVSSGVSASVGSGVGVAEGDGVEGSGDGVGDAVAVGAVRRSSAAKNPHPIVKNASPAINPAIHRLPWSPSPVELCASIMPPLTDESFS
jgi:hypothetical protein